MKSDKVFKARAAAIMAELEKKKKSAKLEMEKAAQFLLKDFKRVINDDEFFDALGAEPSVSNFSPELKITALDNVFVSKDVQGNWIIKLPYSDSRYSSGNHSDVPGFLIETLLKVSGYL